MLQTGELGIHPPGALGVAFFVHAGAESLIGRGGDGITLPLKETGALELQDGGERRVIPLKGRIFANLLEADARDRLPELLLVCCNPDQLGLFTGEMTRFVETNRPTRVLMVTECSMSDNVAAAIPDVEFVRPCNLCPHMKRISLDNIYRALQTLEPAIEIDPAIAVRARRSVERMLSVGQ